MAEIKTKYVEARRRQAALKKLQTMEKKHIYILVDPDQ